jgi:hypothetical protein
LKKERFSFRRPDLAQPDNLQSLFYSLNDENYEIREAAITLVGRLAKRNPAFTLPSLRNTLTELMSEIGMHCALHAVICACTLEARACARALC